MKQKLGRVTKASRCIGPGDHVIAERSRWILPYQHHGTYVGDGRVIHFAGNKICYVTLDKFIGDDDLWNNSHRGQRRYSAAQAVEPARGNLGFKKYGLIDYNCEPFVEWCITGLAFSKQIDDILWFDGVASHSTWWPRRL